ncbi:MAG: TlyA family RNA methyltransferase [Pseudomonadota bacterium]
MGRTRADKLLVERGLFATRAKAKAAIEAGAVLVEGKPLLKPADALSDGVDFQLTHDPHPWVSRAGLKLQHGADLVRLDFAGRIVLDVGASTGGFTEVALARGAAHVFAVDVGHGQLVPHLAADPRVTDLSGTNARDVSLALLGEPVDLILCDVSFISARHVLPPALGCAKVDAALALLIKPQFEAGRQAVGRGGLVKDPAVHTRVVAELAGFVEDLGLGVRCIAQSPIEGGDGNREFLCLAERPA